MMNIIDLTQTLEEGMSIFPGDAPPRFSLVDYGASCITELAMTTHTGTHIDCSAHVGGQGAVDALPPAFFTGRGIAVDCTGCQEEIPAELLKAYDLEEAEFVLLYCGFSSLWNTPAFTGQYPVLTREAVQYLAAKENLRGIGIEYISLDPIDSHDLPLHRLWLCSGRERCIIENLTNLQQLIGKTFTFMALPLKLRGGEGSPVRAIAILDE